MNHQKNLPNYRNVQKHLATTFGIILDQHYNEAFIIFYGQEYVPYVTLVQFKDIEWWDKTS